VRGNDSQLCWNEGHHDGVKLLGMFDDGGIARSGRDASWEGAWTRMGDSRVIDVPTAGNCFCLSVRSPVLEMAAC
jgi:hypothetical protein